MGCGARCLPTTRVAFCFADLPLPLPPLDPPHSLPSRDSKVVWAEHHSPSTPTLGSVPVAAAMLSASPTPAFLWALHVPRAGQQLSGEELVEGEGVSCSLEGLGAFLPQEPCLGHHGAGPVPR